MSPSRWHSRRTNPRSPVSHRLPCAVASEALRQGTRKVPLVYPWPSLRGLNQVGTRALSVETPGTEQGRNAVRGGRTSPDGPRRPQYPSRKQAGVRPQPSRMFPGSLMWSRCADESRGSGVTPRRSPWPCPNLSAQARRSSRRPSGKRRLSPGYSPERGDAQSPGER